MSGAKGKAATRSADIIASQFPDEFKDEVAGRVRLLLVDLGRDDARVLRAPVAEDPRYSPIAPSYTLGE